MLLVAAAKASSSGARKEQLLISEPLRTYHQRRINLASSGSLTVGSWLLFGFISFPLRALKPPSTDLCTIRMGKFFRQLCQPTLYLMARRRF